jgi:hypothetical protein
VPGPTPHLQAQGTQSHTHPHTHADTWDMQTRAVRVETREARVPSCMRVNRARQLAPLPTFGVGKGKG